MFRNVSFISRWMILLFLVVLFEDVFCMKKIIEMPDSEYESSHASRLSGYYDPVAGAATWAEDAEFFSTDEFAACSKTDRVEQLFGSFSTNLATAHNYSHCWYPSDVQKVLPVATKLLDKCKSRGLFPDLLFPIERAVKLSFACPYD
ncbi:MAG: hypothetical protein LBT90_02400 [Holosporaceae bacterium]|nr:hypothetical protein [Holosporaceae bacterium]